MKHITNLTFCAIVMIIFISCKKDTTTTTAGTPGTPITVQGKCALKNETTALSGNAKSFEYTYNDKSQLTSVKVFNSVGGLSSTFETGSYTVVNTGEYLGKQTKNIKEYESADFFNNIFPSKGFVSIDDGDTLRVHYMTFFFFYDGKGRLMTVGEQTDHIVGDFEYDLHIFYNDQDNVTAIQYEWTTGPNQVIPAITATGYDDKPTPYAGIKQWPFLNINFAWDNYDPEPIFTALSKNNPLGYSMGSGADLFTRTMAYTYNADGFPTERKNTNKNVNGEYTFLQTFSYDCK